MACSRKDWVTKLNLSEIGRAYHADQYQHPFWSVLPIGAGGLARREDVKHGGRPDLDFAGAVVDGRVARQGCGQSRFCCSQVWCEAEQGEEQGAVIFGVADGGGDAVVAGLADEAH